MKTKKNIALTDHQVTVRALFLLVLRLGLVAVFSLLTWLVLKGATGQNVAFPPGILLAGLSMLPVNIICLLLTARFMRQEGQSLKECLAPRPHKLLRDIGMGMLWEMVMFIPFVMIIMGTAWLLYGSGMFTAFETIFLQSGQ